MSEAADALNPTADRALAHQPPADSTRLNTLGFFISSLFAFIGGHVMNYSVILYSQDVLGSPALAGSAFFLCFFPPLLLGLYAGVLCDRHSTQWIIGGAQSVFMLSALCLLAMRYFDLGGDAARLCILAAGLCNGIAWSFVAPARLASLGRLVPAEQLAHTSVLFNLIIMVGFGAAPVFIGLTTQAYGWTATFAMGLGLFVLAQISLPLVRMWWSVAAERRTVLHELRAGMSYVRHTPLLWQLLFIALTVFLTMGPIQVVWPQFGSQVLGLDDARRGLYLGSLAIALIFGGILAGFLRPRCPNGLVIFVGVISVGSTLMLMPFWASLNGALILILCSGSIAGLTVSFIVAGLQSHTDAQKRGRVMSFYTICSQVGPALAGLSSGLLADALGVTAGLFGVGLLIAGLGVTAWVVMTELRAYRH